MNNNYYNNTYTTYNYIYKFNLQFIKYMADILLKHCIINKFRSRFWRDLAIARQLRGYMYSRAYIGNITICIVFDKNGQISTHYPLHHDRRLQHVMYRHSTLLAEMPETAFFDFVYEHSTDTRYEIYRVAVESPYSIDVYVMYKIIANDESLALIMLHIADLRILVLESLV